VAQQQWGNQPPYGQPQYGRPPYGPAQTRPGYPAPQGYPPPQGYSPYGAGGYGQPQFGRGPVSSGFGPQFGVPQYGPVPVVPGPRKRSPLKTLLLALIGISVLALGGLVLAGLLSGPSDAAYQNDDYKVPPPDKNPPPIPLPKSYEEAVTYITKNPFYGQTAPLPVRCNSQPINVGTASDDVLNSHFEGLMECLVRVWQPPVTAAGFIIVRPTVTIYGAEITTKCGKSGINAFYCAADQQVYFSNQLASRVEIVRKDKWAADVVMAHEFGHALQGRTGILISSHALGQNANDKAIELEFSRRLETQADCFSGMFLRAVSLSLGVQQADLNGIEQTYEAVGDDTLTGKPDIVGNHGHAKSRKHWGTTGLGTSDVGKCNTFIANKALVR
jgi:predicted metalloprotease